ncbi:unnamed protein product [Caenorhabditis sp. 36 PRJEB53466]|nr:unnamed protein product [Caenorhabditis sp. 36 PRJEB53466]
MASIKIEKFNMLSNRDGGIRRHDALSEHNARANRAQRLAYYMSNNSGTAAGLKQIQYTLENFPIIRDIKILVDDKFELIVSSLSPRCEGIFIGVKMQGGSEDKKEHGEFLPASAGDDSIRKTCVEGIKKLEILEQSSSTHRPPLSKCSIDFLSQNKIETVDEPSEKFPKAHFYCENCDFYMETSKSVKDHLESDLHLDDIEKQTMRMNLLRKIPNPSEMHLFALNRVLQEAQNRNVTNKERDVQMVLSYLSNVFLSLIGDCEFKIELFGSSALDLMLENSDVNVALITKISKKFTTSQLMRMIQKKIQGDGHKAEYKMDMGVDTSVTFMINNTHVRLCHLHSSSGQLKLTKLIQKYCSIRSEVPQFLRLIRQWASESDLDDKNRLRIGLPRYGFDLLAIHFLQQQNLLPILNEKDHTFGCEIWNMADLFINFFRYFAQKNRRVVVQITENGELVRNGITWRRNVLHVVDPFRRDNVMHMPSDSTWHSYFYNCVLQTFISFSIPSTKNEPLANITLFQSKSELKQENIMMKSGVNLANVKKICTTEYFISENINLENILAAHNLDSSHFYFEFKPSRFRGRLEMEIKCAYCNGPHLYDKCILPDVPATDEIDVADERYDAIDEMIDEYYGANIMQSHRMSMLNVEVRKLEEYLAETYRTDVTLTLFGSIMTGLSVNCSDADICLRFKGQDDEPKEWTGKEVIADIGEILKGYEQTEKVEIVLNAKVPIVKMQLKMAHDEILDIDICFYNSLALQNTALLREYTRWTPDNRFAKLALFVKHWAKQCDIGNASIGSLSSYSQVIMLIGYLQQCSPPVLPRIQEDFVISDSEQRNAGKWNTSFAQSSDEEIWKWQHNKESCARLFVGFLEFYARFDFQNVVIQCRQNEAVSKTEKGWRRALCVEDPFNLDHNLTGVVSNKMFLFIRKEDLQHTKSAASAKKSAILLTSVHFVMNEETKDMHEKEEAIGAGKQGSDRK